MIRRNVAGRMALCGMLTALMLVLGYVEHLLPVSAAVPWARLGLSNSVLLFALYMLDTPTAFLLMALKVTLSSALFASFGAFPYALSGGAVSLSVMALAKRLRGVRPVTVSMLGGMAHGCGQVGLAMLLTRTPGLMVVLAQLAPLGLVCGLLTGTAAEIVIRRLRFHSPQKNKE